VEKKSHTCQKKTRKKPQKGVDWREGLGFGTKHSKKMREKCGGLDCDWHKK